jgi:hypothetical protein
VACYDRRGGCTRFRRADGEERATCDRRHPGAAGVEQLMLQWFDLDDRDGLRAFANAVLPQV